MADVDINKFRASVVREGSKPASPGFIVSEGQSPTDPAGSGQNHLPVTIATAATGLSITESQVLGGAGTVGQYIRGDGSLADFPESSGGGSSVSYYLNGSVNQGTIGGVAYKELNKVPILGAGTDFTINADGYIASFITDAGDPNLLEIPGGNWNFETYFSASSSGGTPTFYVELYKVNSGGTATLIASNSTFPELIAFGTNIISYFSTLAVPTTALALTDRLAIRYYVIHSGRTITLHTEDNHLCQIITTFTTGLTALNGLTAQIQNFAVGTSGTDFAISSATATHTFNLPTASATNRGALSSSDWTTFNDKTSNLGTVTSVGLSSATSGVTIGSTPVTTSGTITLAIATASGSQNGLLSSTDWTTFNGKQNALTNPVTGTGASGQVAYFTGTSAISSESNLFWDATNDRLGIGTPSPAVRLHILGNGHAFIIASDNATQLYTTYKYNTSTDVGYIGNGVGAITGGAASDFGISAATGNLLFASGGVTERMRITSGGNLLIGTTTDNGARLQVSGTATFSSSVIASDVYATFGTGGYVAIRAGGAGAAGYLEIISNNGTTRLGYIGYNTTNILYQAENSANHIFQGGNVGIGGTSFGGDAKLGISNSNAEGIEFTPAISSNTTRILHYNRAISSYIGSLQVASVFAWQISGTEAMRITSGGNVLIGTSTDNGKPLQILGVGGLGVYSSNSYGSTISVDFNGGQNIGHLLADQNAYYIRTLTAYPIYVMPNQANGVYLSVGSTSWTANSDERLKNINGIIENAVEKLLTFRAINFSWKSDNLNKEVLGLIAQDVEKLLPQVIDKNKLPNSSNDETEYLGIRYVELIPVLVKAIQEHQEIIKDLKQKIYETN